MSFLDDFVEANGLIESPEMYIKFSGFVALAGLAGGKVWFNLGNIRLLPNIYVALVGPQGLRKTTAMARAKEMLRLLKQPMSAEAQTKESITRDMAGLGDEVGYRKQVIDPKQKKPIVWTPLTICVTELSNFFGFNAEIIVDFLTTIYDEPVYEVKTKNKGNDFITGPCVSLLGCTTPAWIYTYLKKDVLSGGFARRCMFIYEKTQPRRVAFPKVTQEQKQAWDRCVIHAQRIVKTVGEFRLTPEAEAFYVEWYEQRKEPESELVAGFASSMHVQLFKLAMLYSIGRNDSLVITREDLEYCLEILYVVLNQMTQLFAGVGQNPLNAQATQLVDILAKQPKQTMSEIDLRRAAWTFINPRDYKDIILHLVQVGAIQAFRDGRTKQNYYKICSQDKTTQTQH